MRILLTGATGFLGWRTLEKLVTLDWVSEVIATGRTIKPTHMVNHPKAKYVLGDLSDGNFVNQIVTDINVIIHTAGLSSPWGTKQAFETANLIPQKLLISAANCTGINRFVFVSTPSLYFELKDKLNIKESDPLPKNFINQYAVTKRLAEIELEKSGIAYVTLRPRALIGRGDTVIMPRMVKAYDEGKLKIVGNGKNWVDLTSVSNMIDAIVLSIKVDDLGINKTYNITNGKPVQLWKSIGYLLPLLKRQPPSQHIPYFIAVNLARVMELVSKLTTYKEPTLTVYSVGILAKNFTLNISKAQKYLGYIPKQTTEEALEEFALWYKNLHKLPKN